ncbi:unnamed protein product [Gadus morhua 'NCC']
MFLCRLKTPHGPQYSTLPEEASQDASVSHRHLGETQTPRGSSDGDPHGTAHHDDTAHLLDWGAQVFCPPAVVHRSPTNIWTPTSYLSPNIWTKPSSLTPNNWTKPSSLTPNNWTKPSSLTPNIWAKPSSLTPHIWAKPPSVLTPRGSGATGGDYRH